MRFTDEELKVIEDKIVEFLSTNGECRFGKIAKHIIHQGLADSSFVVTVVLQNGWKEHRAFKGRELFESPKTGVWKLSENIKES